MRNTKKTFERDQVFQNTEESKKFFFKKRETRLITKKEKEWKQGSFQKEQNYVFVRL